MNTPKYGPTKIYKDLSFGFELHPNTLDVSKRTDVNAIKQSLITLINTRFGERLFQPDVGSAIPGLLFEPMDTITTSIVQQSIMNCIQNNEPRVVLNDVEVVSNMDNDSVDVTITYTPVGIAITTSFTITLTRLR